MCWVQVAQYNHFNDHQMYNNTYIHYLPYTIEIYEEENYSRGTMQYLEKTDSKKILGSTISR